MEEKPDPNPAEDLLPSAIVARADALMQRRRQFTGLPPELEDVPVLTEVVQADMMEALPPPEATSPLIDPDALDILAHELSRRIQEKLAAQLPGLIEEAVEDFLAEREHLAKLQGQR